MLTLSVVAMEKENTAPPIFNVKELPAELQDELLNTIIINAANASSADQAVKNFKQLRLVSSDYAQKINQKSAIFTFLNAARTHFPGYEVRLARLLAGTSGNTVLLGYEDRYTYPSDITFSYTTQKSWTYARDWLKEIKPNFDIFAPKCPFYPEQITELENIGRSIKKNKLELLKEWLEKGYDPNCRRGYLLYISITSGNLDAIKLLVQYGMDLNLLIREHVSTLPVKPLRILFDSLDKGPKDNPEEYSIFIRKYSDINDYLRKHGARD
ncbi:hypothetical protein J120_02345 [candidate division TM6 bacterium JCVI TM6SC1]|uniref:Ankyrin repeat protein n=1 Tax=candidate division TM6 bacterium JCVI TM6SC1 TaxID=1306947 RepID=A0A0D2JLD4_9BACT|nr:hypothetical protein J120_02345 [candidate division TM6 bacterium JCVI TM6SC1]